MIPGNPADFISELNSSQIVREATNRATFPKTKIFLTSFHMIPGNPADFNKTTLSHSTQARHRCELARASTADFISELNSRA